VAVGPEAVPNSKLLEYGPHLRWQDVAGSRTRWSRAVEDGDRLPRRRQRDGERAARRAATHDDGVELLHRFA
jgi:hypothetical protein